MRTWTRVIDPASKREEIFFDNRGTLLASSYVDSRDITEGKKIGGVSSTVCEAEWQGRKVALKKVNVDSTYHSVSLTSKEVNRMLSLQHRNVVELLGAYLTTQEGQVLECTMIMELMDCNLEEYIEEYIKKGQFSYVVYIFAEVAKGMNHIHKKGCFHQDLKPTNVLLRKSVVTGFYVDVKIADFGSLELMGDGDINRTARTLGYKAPEQFDSTSKLLPEKVDVFGFGALCFKVLTGQKPYESPRNVRETIKQIDRDAISHVNFIKQDLPKDVVQLIWKCLDVNPELRPDFEEIFDILTNALVTIWGANEKKYLQKSTTYPSGGIMEDSPSPSQPSSSHSEEVLQSLHSSPVPRFMLEAVDNASTSHEIELPKHYLPDFNFRMVNGLPHPTTEQFIEVASYFSGCTSVAYTPPFLVVLWGDLPRKPWPLTFGGIPLFYGTFEDRRPPTCGRAGGSQPIRTSAIDYLELGVHPQGKIKEVFQLLVAMGIGIRYFGWSGVHWYAEVLSATDGAKLPSKICGLLVLWKIWENEDSECARRVIVPNGGTIIDNTSYAPTLRPGLLVASKGGNRSTSGIPLLAPNGDRFVTMANHGFPVGDLNVYHPIYGENTLIARIEFPGANSDIALARLEIGNTYSTTSFDGDQLNGTTLDGLIHSNDVPLLTTLYLDSPFNGKCEGLVTSIGVYVLPTGSTNGSFRYAECNMIYFGNGADDIFPGACGSPMWTVDNKVAAFFRWYRFTDAIAFAPVVDILINFGFNIHPIP